MIRVVVVSDLLHAARIELDECFYIPLYCYSSIFRKFFYCSEFATKFQHNHPIIINRTREDTILNAIDTHLFYFFNRDTQNVFFDILMPLVSDEKSWYPLILAGIIYVFYKDYKKASIFLLMVLLALGISDFLTGHFFKPLFGRLRPCNALEDVRLLVGCSDSFSLPSAHASNVSAIGTVVCYEHRKLIIYMALVVLLVCYSRIYMGVHYPFDVFIGMLGGIAYGMTVVGIKKEFFT